MLNDLSANRNDSTIAVYINGIALRGLPCPELETTIISEKFHHILKTEPGSYILFGMTFAVGKAIVSLFPGTVGNVRRMALANMTSVDVLIGRDILED